MDLVGRSARRLSVRSRSLLVLVLLVIGTLHVGGCSGRDGEDEAQTFNEDGVSFRYPKSWHVTAFSTTNAPSRLVVTSYPVPRDVVEGDCGGYEAVELLPDRGALVVLIDYGSALPELRPTEPFSQRAGNLTMGAGKFEHYECFGASTMFRFRVGGRVLQAHVALGPEASDETRDRALAILSALTVAGRSKPIPTTYRERERVVLPVTFPDGSRAELVYPPELDLAGFAVRPYSSGRLRGKSPTPERSDIVARDFVIADRDVDHLLAERNESTPPTLLARYNGVGGKHVGFWNLRRVDLNVRYLGFQFGRWAVLVYDYIGVSAMTDAERSAWSASFSGRETADGFLLLRGSGLLRLARAGEHAGPELLFSAGPERALELFPGRCNPHREQTRVIQGKRVTWSHGFADWCLSDSMRIHASGGADFIGGLIRELGVRNVEIAKR